MLLLLLIVGGLWAGLVLLDSSTDSLSEKAFHRLWNMANTLSPLGSLTELAHAGASDVVDVHDLVAGVRLLQIRESLLEAKDAQTRPCTEVLSDCEWHVL